jgi:hypothetical protein
MPRVTGDRIKKLLSTATKKGIFTRDFLALAFFTSNVFSWAIWSKNFRPNFESGKIFEFTLDFEMTPLGDKFSLGNPVFYAWSSKPMALYFTPIGFGLIIS